MKSKRVYDLPTRLFHWLFAFLFIVAFSIGNTADDDSALFSYHMIAGIVMCFLVFLRLVWGVFGTRYARFSDFALRPKELYCYLTGLLNGDKKRWAGHNPASSWAAIVMIILAVSLGVTGYLMISGQSGEVIEEVHELLANGFVIVVILHITGIFLHTLRNRDRLWKSMLDGRKSELLEQIAPVRSHRIIGGFLLLTILGFTVHLLNNFDSQSRELVLLGSTLKLAEAED